MDLDEYQKRAGRTDQNPKPEGGGSSGLHDPSRDEVIPLLGLVGEVGGLLAEYKKLLRDGSTHRKYREEVSEELGDILWYVANVATKFDLTLGEIAELNLGKVEDRWRVPGEERRLYDEDFSEEQRLPRDFVYGFDHVSIDGMRKLVLTDGFTGESVGDPLTDNSTEDDGYRFHDVLHLAFAACLGWSPVHRKLLRRAGKLKNRMPPELADVEDGGRAQVIEEAIVAAAYIYAADHNFLEDISAVDWQLLRHIKQMTSGIEVRGRTTWEWNTALMQGFAAWRQLRAHGGGLIRGDLRAGTLEFVPRAKA